MHRLTSATRISPTPDLLGESPVWDAENNRLYWVDGVSRRIRWYDWGSGAVDATEVPSMIGSVGLAAGTSLVAGLADGIYRVDPAKAACEVIFKPEPADSAVRFNDGKVDREGRFVCGTMGVRAEPKGELYRVDGEGRHAILANGIRISNSLCFSPDGRTMYFADSLDRRIRAYDYFADDQPLAKPRILFDTEPLNSGPDGATVDSDGCIWVALVQAGKIARVTPAGVLDRIIDAPSDMPSCMSFGGPDLSVLFVTSIKDSGTGRAISRHPAAGYLFAIEGLGVKGLAEPRFGGGRQGY